jgi:hypothetical protein
MRSTHNHLKTAGIIFIALINNMLAQDSHYLQNQYGTDASF